MKVITQLNPFSVRLVTADYYITKPIAELDVTFSEFRGSEVKQLPVLRVFGATPEGIKTCLHIHGVFPYLYIPCEDANPEPKIAYQIANSIDKALNISLKQANSTNQHVYKVILVGGIPFYGFHTKVHQFYKIFFYNPTFIKRVADLLQNGAILGLSYQPHEAHINFTMQFFLDFNLYGMSFINLEYVKFRRKTGQLIKISQDNGFHFDEDLLLPETIEFTSCCEYEIDCLAQHILNRKDVINGNLGANPGLEALWDDEKQRLMNLNMFETLVPTPSQVRENLPATDSHLYHSKKLFVKLAVNTGTQNESTDSNMTLSILNNTLTEKTTELTPDLTKTKSLPFTSKVVYPAETPEDSEVFNATNVILHHPSSIARIHSVCDDTIVDETIVVQLSQNMNLSQINLDNDDMELMVMLKDMEQNIEDDSILGTQVKQNIDEDEDIDEETRNFKEFTEENFAETLTDVKSTTQSSVWHDSFWDNVQNISQLDGSWDCDDEQTNSTESKGKSKLKVGLSKPKRTRPRKIKEENICVNEMETKSQSPKQSIDMERKIKRFKIDLQSQIISPKKSPKKLLRNFEPLNITFENSPTSFKKERTIAKTDSPIVDNSNKEVNLETQMSKHNLFVTKRYLETLQKSCPANSLLFSLESDLNVDCETPTQVNGKGHKAKAVIEKALLNDDKLVNSLKNEDFQVTDSLSIDPKTTDLENILTSSAYDRQNNYIPNPGSSKFFYNLINDKHSKSCTPAPSAEDSQIEENDLGVISFYDTTLYQDLSYNNGEHVINSPVDANNVSPDIHSTRSPNKDDEDISIMLHYDESPLSENRKATECLTKIKINNFVAKEKKIILVPKLQPPSYNDIYLTMEDHNIPLCRHEQPFYSNYKDVGNHIEVGQIILKIKSKSLADLKLFQSSIKNLSGLDIWRENLFLKNNLSQDNLNIKDLKNVLASNRSCILCPVAHPPTTQEVKKWLKTYQIQNVQKDVEIPTVETEKYMLYFPSSPGQEMNNSQMESLSLTPYSPLSNLPSPEYPDSSAKRLHKISQEINDTSISIKSTGKKRKSLSQPQERKLRPRSLRLSLSRKHSIDSNDCTLKYCKELSQSSNDSDIICGQKSILDPSPSTEHSEEILSCLLTKEDNTNCKNNISLEKDDHMITLQDSEKRVNHSTTLGFKFSGENYQDAPVTHENEFLTILVLEVLTSTRGDLCPDPAIDPILAVFYCIKNDCPIDHSLPQQESGIIIKKDDMFKAQYNETCFSHLEGLNKKINLIFVESETLLFQEILNLITVWDPDILCGYEIEMMSWGYIFQRGFILDINMASKISRVPLEENRDWKKSSQEINKEIKLIGRITLDVWRLLRHEIALTSYTFENIMFHIMHERVPRFSYKTLFFWWNHPSGLLRSLSMEYYLTRVTGIVNILQQLDLIGRTSELARLFGIQWYEVMSRGSQFRVESMMIRMTRPRNYVLVSPNMQQRAAMKAPECLPLIMEPESRFYSDPVIVLDFQSLYPSMMIAYNYCFSTCLGKVQNMGRDAPYEFGCTQLKVSPKMLERLYQRNLINWSPCGVGFVKPAVRKGVLPTMLLDILNTRLMVKKAMKKHKNNKTLQKILHSRQLGLKLIANVTYGYTAANFSGRMPCIEVGDSVVAKGRETLDRAIKMVENTPKWNARVVYGDTDSLFVLVAGRSRSDAFDIGAEIAEAVTNDNPSPVKLKLEKIFHPCILQTKKRYVGYMYESKDQKSPEYLAKGIETVRRDGCPAAAKILEKTLRILFDTCDVSNVKSYICREFQKILEGKCNIRDFIFAKEFRGLHNYKPGASLPALEIARQFKAQDHRKEPRDGERLPYVIVSGAPGEALLRLAHHPEDLLADTRLRLNAVYYITRAIIPPLNRCLKLLGADANLWFAGLPRKQVQLYPILDECGKESENKKSTISQYFSKINCAGCEMQTMGGLCANCMHNPQKTMLVLQNKINQWQRTYNLTNKICQSCCGRGTNTNCISIDCPILFKLSNARQDAEQIPFIHKMAQKLLEF